MALEVLFQSTGEQLVQSFYGAPAFSSLATADVSEAHMFTATAFLDSMYGDNQSERSMMRAQTPMLVSFKNLCLPVSYPYIYLTFLCRYFLLENLVMLYIHHSSLLSLPAPVGGIYSIRPVTGVLSGLSKSM